MTIEEVKSYLQDEIDSYCGSEDGSEYEDGYANGLKDALVMMEQISESR